MKGSSLSNAARASKRLMQLLSLRHYETMRINADDFFRSKPPVGEWKNSDDPLVLHSQWYVVYFVVILLLCL